MNIQPVLDILTASLSEVEGDYSGDVTTEEGDRIAGLRDYLELTAVESLDTRAVAEVAYAWLAGVEHSSGESGPSRQAYVSIRKAGLNL